MRATADSILRQLELLGAEVVDRDHIASRLASGRRLRVKLGIDANKPDLHLGHVVPLWVLRMFQDAGHHPVLIIGDFTAEIGDPSGRTEERAQLTAAEVRRNQKTYLAQFRKILDLRRVEVHRNSEWYNRMHLREFLGLLAHFSLKSAWEREDFQKRLRAGKPVFLHEAMYSVLQGYDSVVIHADIEVGAIEQRLNLFAGRELQARLGGHGQDIIMLPYLLGTDGAQKMSKSAGNTINLMDTAADMFGKAMSIPDAAILHYAELAAWMPPQVRSEMRRRLASGANPRDVKCDLAEAIVRLYHGERAAAQARHDFMATFSRRETPHTLPLTKLPPGAYPPVELILQLGGTKSRSEARRLVSGGALEVDGSRIAAHVSLVTIRSGSVIRIGKKRFFRIA